MPLKLIHGPPNSGRAGRIRRALIEVLDRDPVLVVPTVDDVYSFERELCATGAVLGAAVMNFGGLFRTVATAGGSPPAATLTPAQRLGAVGAAVDGRRAGLRPLRASASKPGFPRALERLLGELQEAGLGPADVEAAAATLEGSAYLGDVATLFSGYAEVRDGLGFVDVHEIAREAVRLLEAGGEWWRRPVFVYGFDDLTGNQLDLLRGLAAVAQVTVAVPHEQGNPVLEQRVAPLLAALKEIGVAETESLPADPANTPEPLLFHLEREFGREQPAQAEPNASLVLMRSAGERGEAEAIATEVARLLAAGAAPEEIAIVVRDPARRGPLLASVLESYGVPVALEARVEVATTAVGGSLIALLEAILGSGRSRDLLRYLRGPAGASRSRVDWFERALRRRRVSTATEAIAVWEERHGDPPPGVAELREAAGDPARLAGQIAAAAAAMGAVAGSELEARAAGTISTAMRERAELPSLAPSPAAIVASLRFLDVRVWSGPIEDRVRITDPRQVRAARFDHVFVASLQDGEFPAGGSGVDPFLSERQRADLGLASLREVEVEERYLFLTCLALPRRGLFLSHRFSDENGTAENPSQLLEEVERLLEPGEGLPRRGRELAEVVHRVGDAPSETELARALAAHGAGAETGPLLDAAAIDPEARARIEARLEPARGAEAATRAPGPLTDPAVIESLAAVPAYGGTTLEGFDVCSYRWFVSHELRPQPLDPPPDPLVQGGIAHEVLQRLYQEPPAADRLPRPLTLTAWRGRATELIGEIGAARRLGGHPGERAMLRRVEGWISRFLGEEARRDPGGFEPWRLEAAFSEDEGAERPPLEIDGWRLHGAIDRIDRTADGRAVVVDYKLSGAVTPRKKLEEDGKLQLQLYLLAVAELWELDAVGGLYHPLRGTSERRPRGLVLEDVAPDLHAYGLSGTDEVDEAEFALLLADARRRASAIVARMQAGDIGRDPGPRAPLRGHGECPPFCEFAPICRRDRAPVEPRDEDDEEDRRR